MKKLLFAFASLLLISCTNSDTTVVTPIRSEAIGKVSFTYNGVLYERTNFNYPVTNVALLDGSKAGLYWQATQSASTSSLSIIFDCGRINNESFNLSTIYIIITKMIINGNSTIQINFMKGNGSALVTMPITNPTLTYTEDATSRRLSGTFTSTQCSGSFTNIVKI
jgi:hypothetical protein